VDSEGDVFYFVGHYDPPAPDDYRVFSLDLSTGALLADPLLPTGFNYNFIGFDRSTSTLFGMVYDLGISKEKLVSIDPSTGALTAVGSPINGCCGVPSGVSTVDPNNGVFYFVGTLMSESDNRIFGISTTTGAVLTNPVLPTNYNKNFIEFDPSAAAPQADLSITKTNGLTVVTAGETTTYTITVSNAGPDEVVGATVSDVFPADLSCSWTCVPASGSTCTTGPEVGDINDTVSLPLGGNLVYTAVCNVASSAAGVLTNTATVAEPLTTVDTNSANNTATDLTSVNRAPVAVCQSVTVPSGPDCTADASIDGGTFDPDGDAFSLIQDPPGPYGSGLTAVTLTATDVYGAEDSCQADVIVQDGTAPVISCNASISIIPPDAPISFTATASDDCGAAGVTINSYDCFKLTKKGKRIDKTGSCVVAISGDTVTILDSGGVGDHITWLATASDGAGNSSTAICEVEVVNPGKGH
jgi:uncharacterized repeat protein (TIGR01451 family)